MPNQNRYNNFDVILPSRWPEKRPAESKSICRVSYEGRYYIPALVTRTERQEAFLKLNLELIGPVKFNIRVFQNEDEALTWIKDR